MSVCTQLALWEIVGYVAATIFTALFAPWDELKRAVIWAAPFAIVFWAAYVVLRWC